MNRRSFLTAAGGTASIGIAGCLGNKTHQEQFRAEIEDRGVTVTGMELDDGLIRVAYESSTESSNDDLAEVAMAFVERIGDGWSVDKLEGLARADPDLVWYAESEWAREYLDGAIEAGEYGQLISETMEQTLILDEDDVENGINRTES